MPSHRTAPPPRAAVNVEALRPAIASTSADRHLVGAILLPHALGTQHHDASPVLIAPHGSPRDSAEGQVLPGKVVRVLAWFPHSLVESLRVSA